MSCFARKAHGADRRSGGFQRLVRVGRTECRRQGRKLTAGAGDSAHHGMAVADAESPLSVGHDVDGTGDGDDRPCAGRKRFGECHGLVQRLVSHFVGGVGVYAFCGAAACRQRPDLGDVAPDDCELHFPQEAQCRFGAQMGSACAHGVQHDRTAQPVGSVSRQQHGGDGAAVQRADVEVQPGTQRGDVLDLGGIIRHDGGRPAGEDDVGTVVDGDVVGDVMDKRAFGPDVGKEVPKHGFSFESAQAGLHGAECACAGKCGQQCACNDGTAGGGDEEGDDVGVERDVTGALAHQQDGDGVGTQTAEDGGAEHLAHEGGQQLIGLVEDDAAEQCAEHAARESHQTAQTQQVAQQGGDESHAHAVVRPQQDSAEDVDHVLHRGAFAAEDREGEDAAHDSDSAEHTGEGQLFGRIVFHSECSFSIKNKCRGRPPLPHTNRPGTRAEMPETEEAVEAHWPPLTPEHGFPSHTKPQTQGAPPQSVTRSRFLSVAHRLSGLFARIRRCFPLQSTKDCCGKPPCLRAKILAIRRTPLTKTASKQKNRRRLLRRLL